MNNFSEYNIKKNCPHCDPNSFALKYPLEETDNFWIVCDVHPLIEGHVLIIPKKHLSCIGEYPIDVYDEFLAIFNKFYEFVHKTYGSVSSFEHGKMGQTVFHSHIHILPFNGSPTKIVPEGENNLTPFTDFSYLKSIYEKEDKYLYFSILDKKWIVDTKLGAPRFFRDRFAYSLGVPDRGNWKEMDSNVETMKKAVFELTELQRKWKSY
jgi:diadenosine tetraphosphate (Ap4A) HIT family hydrolase